MAGFIAATFLMVLLGVLVLYLRVKRERAASAAHPPPPVVAPNPAANDSAAPSRP